MNSFPSVLESIDDLSKDQIFNLISLTATNKININSPSYTSSRQSVVATIFLENSTRTKHSFAISALKMGAKYIDFNAETSSIKKGESLEETFLTLFHQGVELCIVRTGVTNQLSEFKKHPPIKLINGGDGVNEHPSQALLDLFTLMELSPILSGKTLAIFGDIVHSRVAHSLIKLLPQFGLKVVICGPSDFTPKSHELPAHIEISHVRDEAISKCDFIYLLRIQKERHATHLNHVGSGEDYLTTYGVSLKDLKRLNKLVPVLHPGPANIGVEVDRDLIKSTLYKGYLQVKNSVPMRMAIIQLMLDNNDNQVGIIHGETV
jgi:aspartate carbamoyltransferase catalytic subunit